MKFVIKSFKEILGYHFNIPSYQRGYRWEKENVEALLDDIQEFAARKKKEEGEFYCLQPVVVRKNTKLTALNKGNDVYDLLDGQQRLTTLWLILNASNFKPLWNAMDRNHPELYSMQYESRDNLFSKALDENQNIFENIDLFYLKSALSTIELWNGDVVEVLNTLVPKNPDKKSNDVRIIWYEFDKSTEESEDSHSSSIKVFSNLNYGKIPLTDTELIKSLILQSDIYPVDNTGISRPIMKEYLFRISTEWDDIEKSLHEELFWGMLTPKEYKPSSRMELVLRFVADQIQAEEKYKIIDKQRRDFYIISNYLGINKRIAPEQYAKNVDSLWTKIRDAYTAMHNWYINDDFYHLIGLIVLIQGGSNPITLVRNIYHNYITRDKDSFKKYLKSEIGKLIIIQEKAYDSLDGNSRVINLDEVQYGSHNSRIIRILEALNIYLHIENKNIAPRFDFKRFKDLNVTSLEHIHPQHLSFDDDVKYDDVKSWFDNVEKIVAENIEYSNNNELKLSIKEIGNLLAKKETFKDNLQQCQSYVENIDAVFDKYANMDNGHMHTLYNMALVDKDTNAALSNNLIDTKRRILQQRESENKTYVPLATNFVFNKHFSSSISDMKFWTKLDREEYFSKIEEAYNYFISSIK